MTIFFSVLSSVSAAAPFFFFGFDLVLFELVAAERRAEREVGDVLGRDALARAVEHDMRRGPLFAGEHARAPCRRD